MRRRTVVVPAGLIPKLRARADELRAYQNTVIFGAVERHHPEIGRQVAEELAEGRRRTGQIRRARVEQAANLSISGYTHELVALSDRATDLGISVAELVTLALQLELG